MCLALILSTVVVRSWSFIQTPTVMRGQARAYDCGRRQLIHSHETHGVWRTLYTLRVWNETKLIHRLIDQQCAHLPSLAHVPRFLLLNKDGEEGARGDESAQCLY